MKSTRSVLYFSLVFALISLCALTYTLTFHGDFVAHNIIFNSIIAGFDAIVLTYAIYTLFYLIRGVKQWEKFKIDFPRDEEEPPLKGGMRLLRGRLRELISFNEDERSTAVSLVAKALNWRVDFMFYAAGAVISMGLLGTFFGLTFTMEGIRGSINVLSSADEIQAKLLVNSLAAPLGGMATAFSSSMFGLSSSICTGLVAHFMGRATDGWVYDIEKWSFVASGEEASKVAGETGTVDVTTRAINRLAAVLSRHVEFSRQDIGKFLTISSNFVEGQAVQQQTMEKLLGVISEQSESFGRSVETINRSAETILSAATANGEATKKIVEVIQNNSQILSGLNEAVTNNSAYIVRGTEAQEGNSQTVAQAVGGLNQIRVEFMTSLEAILGKLKQIQIDTNAIEQSASGLVSTSNEQQEALESAAQIMRVQQKAIMEGMKDLTEARVSIVSAVRAAQKLGEVPHTKG